MDAHRGPLGIACLLLAAACFQAPSVRAAEAWEDALRAYRTYEALPLFTQALRVFRRVHGGEHPAVATCLHNLAALHVRMGEHAKASPLYTQALGIYKRAHGEEHPDVARCLMNLAGMHQSMGEYGKALPLITQSLEMRRKLLGQEHPAVATCLNNLAGLYQAMGEYGKALRWYTRALEIYLRVHGEEHPAVATCLHNLGEVYSRMGEYPEALPLLTQASRIFKRVHGEEHPAVATCLYSLAALRWRSGEHDKALPLITQALEMQRELLGEEHPDVASSLINCARLAVELKRLEDAWTYAHRARKVLLSTRARAGTSAITRSASLGVHAAPGFVVSLALRLRKGVDMLELVEQQHSLALRELLALARAQAAAGIPAEDRRRVMVALGRMNALNAEMERLVSKGLPAGEVRQRLQQAEMQYDAVMADLSQRYEHFVATDTARGITSAQAARSVALDDHTAVVGWVGYRDWLWGYVVRKSAVKWVDLGSGYTRSEEHERIRRILAAVRDRSKARLAAQDMAALYKSRFAPLEAHLEGVTKLIVISQDIAAYLPVEMLLTREPGQGEEDMAKWPWLCDRYEVSYAPSVTSLDILCRERDKRGRKPWARPLFALGDPPFSLEQLAQMEAKDTAAWSHRSMRRTRSRR